MLKLVLLNFGQIFCDVMSALIMIQVVLSWIVVPSNKVYQFVYSLTKPLLSRIRAVLPDTRPLDLSPLVAFFLIEAIRAAWLTIINLL